MIKKLQVFGLILTKINKIPDEHDTDIYFVSFQRRVLGSTNYTNNYYFGDLDFEFREYFYSKITEASKKRLIALYRNSRAVLRFVEPYTLKTYKITCPAVDLVFDVPSNKETNQ